MGGGIGVDSHLVHRYAHLLNCSVMSMPFTYLGIPIGAIPIGANQKEEWVCGKISRVSVGIDIIVGTVKHFLGG